MRIHGSICALVTPFDAAGELDLDAFTRLIEYQLDGGTQALVVAGSTGEAHMLTGEEFARALGHAIRVVRGRVPVVAGCGTAATASTIAACRRVAALGADAALVVTPYYVRPEQRGLVHHFRAVADHGRLPVIMYNVPGRTACDMQPETVAALRDHPRIIGIKDAVGTPQRQQALAALADADFIYLSGDDGSARAAMLAGAGGTVSVVANAAPGLFRELCDAACAGAATRSAAAAARLEPLLAALECAPNPVPIKAALAALEICREDVRAPLLPLDDGSARDHLRDCALRARSVADTPA